MTGRYSVKITYVTGTEDVKIVKAGSLKEAWQKIVCKEIDNHPTCAIKAIEVMSVLETY